MDGTLKGKVCFCGKARVFLVKVLLRVEKKFTMQVLEMAENGLCKWQFLFLVTELLC